MFSPFPTLILGILQISFFQVYCLTYSSSSLVDDPWSFNGSHTVSAFKGVWALGVIRAKLYLIVSLQSVDHLKQPEHIANADKNFWLYTLRADAFDQTNGNLLLSGITPQPLVSQWMANETYSFLGNTYLFKTMWPSTQAAFVNFWFVATKETAFSEAYLMISYCFTNPANENGWTHNWKVQLNMSTPCTNTSYLKYEQSASVAKLNETWLSSSEKNTVYVIGRAKPRLSRYTLSWEVYPAPRTPWEATSISGIYWICRKSTASTDRTIFLSVAVCPLAAVEWNIFTGYVSETHFYLFSRDRRVYIFEKVLFLQYNPQTAAQFTSKTFDEFFWNKANLRKNVSNFTVNRTGLAPDAVTHYTVVGVVLVSLLTLAGCALYFFACRKASLGEASSASATKISPDVSDSKPAKVNPGPSESKGNQTSDDALVINQSSTEKKEIGSLAKESDQKKKKKLASKRKQTKSSMRSRKSSKRSRKSSKRSKKSKKKKSRGKSKSKEKATGRSVREKPKKSRTVNKKEKSDVSLVKSSEQGVANKIPFGSCNANAKVEPSSLMVTLMADKPKKATKTKALSARSVSLSNDGSLKALKMGKSSKKSKRGQSVATKHSKSAKSSKKTITKKGTSKKSKHSKTKKG